MTLVTITLTVPDGQVGDPEAPAVGYQQWMPVGPGARRRAESPAREVLPAPFRVDLLPGVTTVEVAPTSASWVWLVREYVDGAGTNTRTIAVPDQPTIDYRDCPRVDPASLTVVGHAPDPIWQQQLDALAAQIADLPSGGGGGAVSSVAGRTGAVVLSSADLTDVNTLATDVELAAGLAGKANSSHTHDISDVSGLQSALAGKQPAGSYAASSHGHDISDVSGLQSALAGKQPAGSYAASSHGHGISDVSGLQTALDGKQPAGSYAASSHTHTPASITNFTETTQDIIGAMVTGAGGTYNDAAGTITLPAGGGGGAVDSVAGRAGAVVLSSADLTDAASLATDAELTAGLAGKANTSHTHAPEDITGTAVITTDPRLSDARTPTAHTHPASAISDSTAIGRSVLTAADAAAARTAIGAGTSNLAIGTTGTTAAAGNRQATDTAIGMVELATTAEATTGTDTTRAVTPAGLKAVADTKAASSHTHTSTNITDLTEAVQDVVGTMVAGAGGTYDDVAGTVTLPSGGGDAAVGSVQFVVSRVGEPTTIAQSAWTTYPLNGLPTANIGGGSWDNVSFVFTVPSTGLYLCLGAVRVADSSPARSVGVGIGTTNSDGPHVLWQNLGGVQRSGTLYTRIARFNEGDQVRMYIYTESEWTTQYSGGVATGQSMSLIKLAD